MLVHSISLQIVDGSKVHHQQRHDPHYRREDLQALRVLNVTKRESKAQCSEDGDGHIVDPWVFLFQVVDVLVGDE